MEKEVVYYMIKRRVFEEQPMVSAIIITHNRVKLLKRALKSVFDQTYKNIEIIVVDDASDDGTNAFGIKLLDRGVKYIYIPKDESRGGNFARNVGILNSNGEMIAFLDDDDYWCENKTEIQVDYFLKNPEVGMVYSGLMLDYGVPFLKYARLYNKKYQGDILKKQLYYAPFCTTITMMVKREIIEKIGKFDENISAWQEYELSLRLIQVTKVGYINKVLAVANRDIHIDRVTNEFEQWRKSVLYINRKHKKLFDKLDYSHELSHKEAIFREAAYRASMTSGKKTMKMYYKKAFLISHKIEYLIRLMFSLSKKDTLLLEVIIRKITFLLKENKYEYNDSYAKIWNGRHC